MNNLLIEKLNVERSIMSLLLKNYSLVKVIYWKLIGFNETNSFLLNTKNTDINGTYEQNKHKKHREQDKF